jgi:hypothetical protein
VFIASLVLAAQFDPAAEEVHDTVRARNSRIAAALRAVSGLDAADPDLDPLVGAVRRWVNSVDPKKRDAVLARILAQLDEATAVEVCAHFDRSGNG